jgi:hypothetical protein
MDFEQTKEHELDYAAQHSVPPYPRPNARMIARAVVLIALVCPLQSALQLTLYANMVTDNWHMTSAGEWLTLILPTVGSGLVYFFLLRSVVRFWGRIVLAGVLSFIALYLGMFIAVNKFGS